MKSIEESMLKFLEDDKFKVALLKGEWGVGKTFFWRNFLAKHRTDLSFRAYSYVSLFGATDISDLKKQIFSNFETINEANLSKHFEKIKALPKILETFQIPYLNSSSAMSHLIDSKFINEFLICFDDLERKESSISVSSVLGMISELKEDRNCKIILILNDEALEEKAQQEFKEYREKIVDIEICYKPSIQDNLKIIWPDGCAESTSSIFNSLELNNIRIMQRVRWAQEYFENFIKLNYTNLVRAFEYKAAALTVLYHAYGNILSFEEIISTNYYSLLFADKDLNKEADKFAVLKKLTYYAEDYDQVVVDYLVDGYVDYSKYYKLLGEENEKLRLNDVNNSHRELWSGYYSNFKMSQAEFVESQKEFLIENYKDLKILDVVHTVKFLKNLDADVTLDHLVEHSIDTYVSNADRNHADRLGMMHMPKDLVEKIQAKMLVKQFDCKLPDLISEIAGGDGWRNSDILQLRRFTEDDFYHWITQAEETDVIHLLKTLIERIGHNENGKIVTDIIKVVLNRVSERSEIDRMRVTSILSE